MTATALQTTASKLTLTSGHHCSFDLHKAYISQQRYCLGSFRKLLSSLTLTIFQNVDDSRGDCERKITEEKLSQAFSQVSFNSISEHHASKFWRLSILSLRLDRSEMSTFNVKKKVKGRVDHKHTCTKNKTCYDQSRRKNIP